jgi:hypothetical protein
MIDDGLTSAWNNRVKIDLQNLKRMNPAQLDRIKNYGSSAENLLQNKEFALFIHHYKFDLMESLGAITGHTTEENNSRIGIAHNLAGVDGFISSLQRAKWYKDKVVSYQTNTSEVTPN